MSKKEKASFDRAGANPDVWLYVCTYVRMYVFTYSRVCVCMYVRMYACMHAYHCNIIVISLCQPRRNNHKNRIQFLVSFSTYKKNVRFAALVCRTSLRLVRQNELRTFSKSEDLTIYCVAFPSNLILMPPLTISGTLQCPQYSKKYLFQDFEVP